MKRKPRFIPIVDALLPERLKASGERLAKATERARTSLEALKERLEEIDDINNDPRLECDYD